MGEVLLKVHYVLWVPTLPPAPYCVPLQVMTLVEGAGPFKAAGVMLEATALAAP